jgi:hypothetical protein
LQGVALDVYSNFSSNDGGISDIPLGPAFVVRNSLTVPAGYTNIVVYSSVSFKWGYDTNGNGSSAFMSTNLNGSSMGYQAVSTGSSTDMNGIQLSSNVFSTASLSISASSLIEQTCLKQGGAPGQIGPFDSSLVVLAYTI